MLIFCPCSGTTLLTKFPTKAKRLPESIAIMGTCYIVNYRIDCRIKEHENVADCQWKRKLPIRVGRVNTSKVFHKEHECDHDEGSLTEKEYSSIGDQHTGDLVPDLHVLW